MVYFRFKQVEPKRVSDFILEQLEEKIILKEILPDEQLPPERELASIFKASRLAVREAIAALEEKKLVEKRLGLRGGTFVLPLTSKIHERNRDYFLENWDDLRELLEYRCIVEPEAARLATHRITPEQMAKLKENVELSGAENCSRETFRSLDVKFHLTIAAATQNRYVEEAVRRIRTKINPGLDLMPYNRDIQMSSYLLHKSLLEFMKKDEADRVAQLMKEHVEKTFSKLTRYLTLNQDMPEE